MSKDKNQLMKKNTMENTNEMKDTNRRQFLKTTLYASFALGLSACGKSVDVDAPAHTSHVDMDHPFHIHGNHFQVVSIEQNGKIMPTQYLAWKDTVNTRAGQTVRLKIAQKHTGVRMYHCHILEHEDLGMMGQYEVLA